MDFSKVTSELKDFDPVKVNTYIKYCQRLATEKEKKNGQPTGKPKNPWFQYKKESDLIELFKKVASDKLYIDGVNVTIQSTGVSYNYIAYKNKMYSVYPDTIIDVQLVYVPDVFESRKESGKVRYSHIINEPFNRYEKDIIGGYCVIKNKRGEFLTLLTKAEIDKHRKVAKTDNIWRSWFAEMALKTVVKKACKLHYADMYQNIEMIDNENYDLNKSCQPEPITEEQAVEIGTLIGELGEDVKPWLDWVGKGLSFAILSVKDIPAIRYKSMIMALNARKEKNVTS